MSTTTTTFPGPKIDTEGNYLAFPGYTIIAHALHPLPEPLTDLVNYLSSSELRQYYSFLPSTSYHVTINPLRNVGDEHQPLLQAEQHKLCALNTTTICTVEKLIRSKVLFIEVQFKTDKNPTFENMLQKVRSNELQQGNILHSYALSWHLTLAYQYKDIESNETKSKLDQIIKYVPQSSHSAFDIPLDHIRICHYDDMTKFTPV